MNNDISRGHSSGAPPTRDFGDDEIRAALDRVVGSDTFARSERSRELLRYVIERDLEGEADRLKGFAIAIDVFDREDSFDPSTDAVVRVQASRLRDLLDTYYAGEGQNDRIRITIPRGSYVPAYECLSCRPTPPDPPADEGATEAEPAPAVAVRGPRRVFAIEARMLLPAVAFAVLMLGANIWLVAASQFATAPEIEALAQLHAGEPTKQAPSVALPSVTLDPDMDETVAMVLEDAIPQFGSVIYRTDRSVTLNEPLSDFYIRTVPAGRNSINVQLYDRASGALIASDQIPGDPDMAELRDHVARITSRFLPAGGVIYAFLETEGRLNPLTRCLNTTASYFTNRTEQRHFEAYRCSEDLVDEGVSFALLHANMASLVLAAKIDGYTFPLDLHARDALDFARRAVELSPGSAIAYRALAWAQQASNENQLAHSSIEQATKLNPYDLGIAASYGSSLLSVGKFAKATEVMERVMEASPVHPSWWDFTTFIAAFQVGRTDLVAISSRNLGGHNRSHYCAARMIAADMTGDEELRLKMLQLMNKHHADFLAGARDFFAGFMPVDAADKLVTALRHAGLREMAYEDG